MEGDKMNNLWTVNNCFDQLLSGCNKTTILNENVINTWYELKKVCRDKVHMIL